MSKNLKNITATAMLLALEIILSRFLSYSVWNSKIGFGFVAVALCGLLFGPVYALILGGLADFLGAVLFPIGPYFFGFTLTAMLTGLCFGIFLYKKANALKILLCVFINQFILGLVVNSFWIHLLYGTPFSAVLIFRIPQSAILLAVQFVTILVLNKLVVPQLKRVL
ncbi:MAG: folate family ECF transporter S component [Ruminococcaceae bacterium]|nr:folate family ECF transporter S component [Oscillospiraceae bacterium]